MANIGYVRVSSITQNTGRQFVLFEERGIHLDKTYTEKVSGKNIKDRPQLQEMLKYVREGDTVYIESISRLARNIMDLLKIVEQLQEKHVELVSLKETIDTSTPQGKFLLSIFGAMAQLERDTIFTKSIALQHFFLFLRKDLPVCHISQSFNSIDAILVRGI